MSSVRYLQLVSRFLGRDSCASHLSLVIDLLEYSGDACLMGISDLVDKEYSHLSDNPVKESKLMQDNKTRPLITRVTFLPDKTDLLMHHSKPSPSIDALTKHMSPSPHPYRYCL